MKRYPAAASARGHSQSAGHKCTARLRAGVTDGYRLAVKTSARRAHAAVGEWVNREGPHRRFDSKALAREWARECSGPRTAVWVQDAPPADDTDADGYLVAGERAGGTDPSTDDAEQASLRGV